VRVFRDDAGNFAIGPGRVTIATTDMRFVTDVVADFGRIVHTPSGEEVIRQGDALGHGVIIVQPDPPTDPPNGWVIPDDLALAGGSGAGTGSTIAYDPADWPWRGDPQSPSSAEVLTRLLRQANQNAAGKSDPAARDLDEPT
jgi:hypothetical protein